MRKPARRRRLALTSLIDVIFLLLLFFMLSSTFTRFAEVELAADGAGGAASGAAKPFFLRLSPAGLDLNGTPVALDALKSRLGEEAPVVLVSLAEAVTAQRLTDLLVALRAVPGVQVTVLERS
ncbi:biopolymer transporter ExbD [Tropicibacter sp. S64]|uniref:biopolymer transporter ExbD n=1 Tax=Tropicibacter sp. S64 TaxID=3415122 RepID=UPI003C7DD494